MRHFYILVLMYTLLTALSCSDDRMLNETPVYQLSAAASPEGAGNVTPTEGEYEAGEEVEITATPNEDWVFESWQGDYTGNSNPAAIVVDSDMQITAHFEMRDFSLTIETEGEGVVYEQLLKQKSTDYEAGSVVQLTAVAEDGWYFSDWQGDLSGGENPAIFEMDSEKSITAVFVQQRYALNIETEGGGSVTKELLSGEQTAADYEHGAVVELTAGAEEGWRFDRWERDLSGSENPIQIEMTKPADITAVFTQRTFRLTIDTEGSGSVAEELISGQEIGDEYAFGSLIRVIVTPANNWKFVEWSGDISGTENPVEITIDGHITATAHMESNRGNRGNRGDDDDDDDDD